MSHEPANDPKPTAAPAATATTAHGTGSGAADMKLMGLGVAALVTAFALAAAMGAGPGRFLSAYLVSYAFFLSIALGSLFFVMIQHLVGAEWSVVVRRLAELAAGAFPMLAILFIPIALSVLSGTGSLYVWAQDLHHMADKDLGHLIEKKAAWLNGPFFVLRWAIYLGGWTWLAQSFLRRSLEQDKTGDVALTEQCEVLSAPGILFFGLSITFAAFDLLMSLSPAWFSTIFGVYYFGGSAIAVMATLIVASQSLMQRGLLPKVVNEEHYHDLGKFLFGFIFFWGYIAFSQFMLIWYAHLPEETFWFYTRMSGPWAGASLVLLFGKFAIPVLGVISRHVKRNFGAIKFWAVWMLVAHWFDMFWLVMPEHSKDSLPLGPVELLCALGIGALAIGYVVRIGKNVSLLAERDPRLPASLAFHNF